MSSNYNIVRLPLDDGIKNQAIGGRDYLIVLEAPSRCNLTIKINDNTADEIPLKENYSLSGKNVRDIIINADAVAGGVLMLGQAKTEADFSIKTSPSLEFSDDVLNSLRFAPRSSATLTIPANSTIDFNKGAYMAIRFICEDEFLLSLDDETEKYPTIEDILYLDNLSDKVVFHNENAFEINIILWTM